MTREEAIKQYIMPALKRTWNDDRCIEIISAIEQEPSEDAISRQAVDEIKELMTDINGDTVYAVRMSDIRQLPPVNPQPKTGEWQQDHEILKAYSDGANEMLDKIRDEIETLPRELPTDARNMVRKTRVLDIIDKYTEGVRDKE